MNNVTHFEIPAEDIKRAQDFYAELFDWDFNMMEEMNYLMIEKKNDKGEMAVSGGILKKQNPQHTITNYVNVDDIDKAASKIEELGGKILVPKTPVPNMGWFVHFLDTEQNVMAVWQNDPEAK